MIKVQQNDALFMHSYVSRSPVLHAASSFGVLAAVDLLLERGASINSTANPNGMTPLHFAAIGGHDDVCARLISAGAKAIKDKLGRTALAYATKFKRDEVRRRLLAAVTTSNTSLFSSNTEGAGMPSAEAPASQATHDDESLAA